MTLNKFQNIENKEDLVGCLVLVDFGNRGKRISKIAKVTKTGFRIFNQQNEIETTLYDFFGRIKGKVSVWETNYCTLISEKEANDLRSEWKEKRIVKELKESLIKLLNEQTFHSSKIQAALELLK